ncbi:aquaporin rerated protein, other eukaryote [Entomortierella parvispora]|uniref:Aquaporin rerated protein, other eukaryote n=1 Tax=Entomortierella parvispora TaxID=205924 RepID=A0A9P3H1M0_9FUNG|nr:aquaporin rerated protein, other eukaryote [Entomortierella parvispora]
MDAKSSAKGWGVQALAEFLGTAMFLYLAIGGADAVYGGVTEDSSSLGVAFAFGVALVVTAWAFFRISGAHFNPAITLSSLITGHITVPKAVLYFIAQILGAMLGVALVRGTTPSSGSIGQINELRNNESIARGFFLEFFLTSILCFVYHMIVHEKNRSTFMAALPYGLALFSCYLFATRYTNASINPARAFATSVVARSFSREHWIFWFGPFGGAILAAALHILFRFLDYDQYSAGIDAENQAQYLRAQAAVSGGDVHNVNYANNNANVNANVNANANANATYANNNYGPNDVTTTNTTTNVLPR